MRLGQNQFGHQFGQRKEGRELYCVMYWVGPDNPYQARQIKFSGGYPYVETITGEHGIGYLHSLQAQLKAEGYHARIISVSLTRYFSRGNSNPIISPTFTSPTSYRSSSQFPSLVDRA